MNERSILVTGASGMIGTAVTERLLQRGAEVARYVADFDKARKILGYEPSYGFREGMEETIAWYRDNDDLLDGIEPGDESE